MSWTSEHKAIGGSLPIELPSTRPVASRRDLQRRGARPPRRRRALRSRWRQAAAGVALSAAGASLLAALMAIPQRFDGVLLVSKAIADLITGLYRLGFGLLQLTGVLVVALLALMALLLLAGGLVRIIRAVLGRPLSRGVSPTRIRPAATTTRER